MVTEDKLLKLLAMANTLTAQTSTLSNAILAMVEDGHKLDDIRLAAMMQNTKKKRAPKAQASKVKKTRRSGKRVKKAEAQSEAPKAEETK